MFSDTHPVTGRAVLAITLSAFGTIVGANVALAVFALGTFPGLEVANSYVASQSFDADARAQRELGWTAAVEEDAGRVILSLNDASGMPVRPADLSVLATRPTEAAEDQTIPLAFKGQSFRASAPLARGRWRIRIRATAADGTPFRTIRDLTVGGPG
jgi:nitrogen fixation protein FixH